MEELKLREAPIVYSRQLGTYYYSRAFLMNICIDFRPLLEEEERKFAGGFNLYRNEKSLKVFCHFRF